MALNFKSFAILALILLTCNGAVLGQDNSIDGKRQTYVQLKPALAIPVVVGNNFLTEGYDHSLAAFMGDARVFFENRVFLGLNLSFFKADVIDISQVGGFDRTDIWHSYLTSGYALMPRHNKFGLDLGAGLGYARYDNRRGGVNFFEDGLSLMGNLQASYRMSQVVGVGAGVQFAKDFLSTDTAPELEKFFKNASILYFSVGLVFYINQ